MSTGVFSWLKSLSYSPCFVCLLLLFVVAIAVVVGIHWFGRVDLQRAPALGVGQKIAACENTFGFCMKTRPIPSQNLLGL